MKQNINQMTSCCQLSCLSGFDDIILVTSLRTVLRTSIIMTHFILWCKSCVITKPQGEHTILSFFSFFYRSSTFVKSNAYSPVVFKTNRNHAKFSKNLFERMKVAIALTLAAFCFVTSSAASEARQKNVRTTHTDKTIDVIEDEGKIDVINKLQLEDQSFWGRALSMSYLGDHSYATTSQCCCINPCIISNCCK